VKTKKGEHKNNGKKDKNRTQARGNQDRINPKGCKKISESQNQWEQGIVVGGHKQRRLKTE